MAKAFIMALGVIAIATRVVDARPPAVVDCKLDKWKADGLCDTATFTQKWTRAINVQPNQYGKACGKTEEWRSCKPVHCEMSKWTEWTEDCNAGGYKTRTRKQIRKPKYGGRACPHSIDKVKCCDEDCRVSDWSDWKCEANTESRKRTIVRQAQGPKGAPCPSAAMLKETNNRCRNHQDRGGNNAGDDDNASDE